MAAQSASAHPWEWLRDFSDPDVVVKRDVEAFWQCLTLDKADDQTPAPDTYGDCFTIVMFRTLLRFEGFPKKEDGTLDVAEDGKVHVASEWFVKRGKHRGDGVHEDFIHNGEQWSLFGPQGDPLPFLERMSETLPFCKFFVIKAKHMGIGPMSVQPEDKIAIFSGAGPAKLMRQKEQDFALIGDCYVHHPTDGESLLLDEDDFEEIRLV